MPKSTNILTNIPDHLPEELHERIAGSDDVEIRRIVSKGHVSEPGFWYDQDQHEWVMVFAGKARILFAGDRQPVELGAGDYVDIPAHQRHRVEWVAPGEETIWLAIYY